MDFLSNNAHVRILCTARYATSADLQPAVDLLKSLGLRVSFGKSINAIHHQMGGDVNMRTQDFMDAYLDDDIDIMWIARGGYGTIQLIDKMDMDGITLLRKRNQYNPKLIIGYSDITYLHARLNRLKIQSIHSFMPLELIHKPESAVQSLKTILSGQIHEVVIPNNNNLKDQEIEGTVLGGNLSILYGLLGSDDFPDTDQRILFIEDIDEYLYHIERMMFALKRAGKLDNLKALIVGGMTDMNDHDIPFGKSAFNIIKDITSTYNFPILFNFPAGHIKDHRSIILGTTMHISIDKDQVTFNNNMAQHNELGRKGEDLAVAHLEKSGYTILTRNYVYLKGEIDIIAQLGLTIIIVEVKTRSTPEWGDPQDFLKQSQINRLVTTANHYIEHYTNEEVEVRFDIIAIVSNKSGTRIEHLEKCLLSL